jgi:epidermal growth factor receptor substrate 15
VKTNTPDFDAAFAGLNLAPAQEAEDDDDEPEALNKNTDFDFSFDSPSHSKREATSSTDAGNTGSSEFLSFDNNLHATAQPTGSANGGDAANHDWDALFAPLQNAKPASEEGTSTFDPKKPGWALNTDTGEDDLILQRLTGMGFPRDDSLTALEKFDYNLDKVSLNETFWPQMMRLIDFRPPTT